MIMRHIDRSRSTGGGMAISFAIHAGLLLMLGLMLGHQAAMMDAGGELTEIAYIEATYGEDVAAKVKLRQKTAPVPKPEPPGRGVNTDNAFKPKDAASSEPLSLAAKSVETPVPVTAPQAKPRLQQAPVKSRMKVPKPVAPVKKPVAAQVEVAAPIVQPTSQPKALAQAAQLDTKAPRPKSRRVIDANKLGQPVKTLQTADASVPAASSPRGKEAFTPQAGGLKSRTGTVATGDDVLAAAGNTSRRGPAVAEAGAGVSSGGSLKSAGRSAYVAPQSALTPSDGSGSHTGSAGVVDVAGPSGGGSKKSGRKTLLDYGNGNGGRGGALSGRQRIAEPAVGDVVSQPNSDSKPRQAVAEAKLAAKGVNMSITGQIQGRKILHSSPAIYTDQARKKGWEGVVAVHFTVLADGRVKDNMYFEQTSVHRDLNQAARAAIKKFRFAPLGTDQAAVEQWGIITIIFKLK